MPVRLRITFLFTLVVFIILGLVCGAIFYFSYTSRTRLIKIRLTNRAITTARRLSQFHTFDPQLVARIDSITLLSVKDISIQAYNYQNNIIYSYSDLPGDTLTVTEETLDDARVNGSIYFTKGDKDVIAYHYTDDNARIVIVCAAEDRVGKQDLWKLKEILLLSFVGGVLVTLIGGFFFSRGLLRPVRRITNEVTEITAHNLARRIPTGKVKDEWFQLSFTLNELLNRLQESFELQRRFIANASHELSTPLTSISSQLEVSLQRQRTEEEYRKVLSAVLQDVRQMSKLTRTLLEFANAAGDKGGINLSLIRIDEILMAIPGAMQKQDPKYQVTLRFSELPENEDQLLVFGNEELLVTAINNIVANACKYSPDHRAEISFVMEDAVFVIHVADKGPGIPAKELSHIFQPFYRRDESRTTEGFGLGLPLASRIIKLHKGVIEVQSKPGEGTIFTMRIPSAIQQQF